MSKRGLLRTIPEKVSNDVRALNPQLYGALTVHPEAVANRSVTLPTGTRLPSTPEIQQGTKRPGKKRKEMNKTEAEFSRFLESMVAREEIIRWGYEEITLRWGTKDVIRYTPDFVIYKALDYTGAGDQQYPAIRMVLVEVKGAHCWAKDRQKFVQARNVFPLLEFQFWRRDKDKLWEQTD